MTPRVSEGERVSVPETGEHRHPAYLQGVVQRVGGCCRVLYGGLRDDDAEATQVAHHAEGIFIRHIVTNVHRKDLPRSTGGGVMRVNARAATFKPIAMSMACAQVCTSATGGVPQNCED